MAAELIPGLAPHHPHHFRLPPRREAVSAAEELRYRLGPGQAHGLLQGPVILEADDWLLTLPELGELRTLLEAAGLRLVEVQSRLRETLVAASALGVNGSPSVTPGPPRRPQQAEEALTIHEGTLRSGDHLQAKGSVLVLGDANPGSRISAGGNVMVWGQLRGVAHAGRHGDRNTRIVALQLRPVQLRIADVVARGPEELPPAGMAEEARIVEGTIHIDPARPGWP